MHAKTFSTELCKAMRLHVRGFCRPPFMGPYHGVKGGSGTPDASQHVAGAHGQNPSGHDPMQLHSKIVRVSTGSHVCGLGRALTLNPSSKPPGRRLRRGRPFCAGNFWSRAWQPVRDENGLRGRTRGSGSWCIMQQICHLK